MTEIIPTGQRPGQQPDQAELVERILAEYEPLAAGARRALARVWDDRSISKTHLFVLLQLQVHGPVPMSRLAGLLDAGLPNVTGIVTRMGEHRLVERVRDDRDRRVVLVRITDQGRDAIDELEAIRRQHLRELLAQLSPDERDACLEAFRALRAKAERLDRNARPAHDIDAGAST